MTLIIRSCSKLCSYLISVLIIIKTQVCDDLKYIKSMNNFKKSFYIVLEFVNKNDCKTI